MTGVLDPEDFVLMAKPQELVQVFGIVQVVLCMLVLAQATGVTYKIFLKLAGVSKRLWRLLLLLLLFFLTRPDFDTAVNVSRILKENRNRFTS